MADPYRDPDTGVPHNKLGIKNETLLREYEYLITTKRDAELRVHPVAGKFDLAHLQAIHGRLFGDLYEWAGKIRTINFSKRDPVQGSWVSNFADREKIPLIAQEVAVDLREWNYLRGTDAPEFVSKLTATYAKVNYMHPFPEGNGRSTRIFLDDLARGAGFELDYSRVPEIEWNRAAARSMPQQHMKEPGVTRSADVEPVRAVFGKIAVPARARELGIER